MKKLIALLALLPLLAMGGGQNVITGNHRHVFAAASHHFNVVQYGTCSQPGLCPDTTNTCTFSSGIASGDSVFIVDPYGHITSTTNSLGTLTWFPTFVTYGRMGIITGGTGGTSSFTVPPVPGCVAGHSYLGIAEVSGINSSAPVEISVGMTGKYGNSGSTGSVTTTGANDEICGLAISGTGSTFASGTGYTALSFTGITGSYPFILECTTAIAGPGTYNPTVTLAPGNNFDEGTVAFTLN
jgi:hypothetical protein